MTTISSSAPPEGTMDIDHLDLRVQLRFPVDPRHAEPDERVFLRYDLELVEQVDDDGDERVVAAATLFCILAAHFEEVAWAADSEPTSEFLDEVCAELFERGHPREEVSEATGWELGDIYVLDTGSASGAWPAVVPRLLDTLIQPSSPLVVSREVAEAVDLQSVCVRGLWVLSGS